MEESKLIEEQKQLRTANEITAKHRELAAQYQQLMKTTCDVVEEKRENE
jgi:hypothetical protein